MSLQIDPNTFRLRVEQKINVIAKAVNWIVGLAFFSTLLLIAKMIPESINPSFHYWIAFGGGAIASWVIVERPMGQIEKRLPLFPDDNF